MIGNKVKLRGFDNRLQPLPVVSEFLIVLMELCGPVLNVQEEFNGMAIGQTLACLNMFVCAINHF